MIQITHKIKTNLCSLNLSNISSSLIYVIFLGTLLFPISAVRLNAAPINTYDHLLKPHHNNNSYTQKSHYDTTVNTTFYHHTTYTILRQGNQSATIPSHHTHLRCAVETLPPSRRTPTNSRASITYAANQQGIWPSRDPIGEDGGVNLYAFVANEPIGRWDLLGKKKILNLSFATVKLEPKECG
ncbi:MAG: hypothetical protein ACI9E1_002077, partial [Cryomorphaceae bacterium]